MRFMPLVIAAMQIAFYLGVAAILDALVNNDTVTTIGWIVAIVLSLGMIAFATMMSREIGGAKNKWDRF